MWQATYTRPPKDQVLGTSPYSESNHGCTMPSYRRYLSTLDSGLVSVRVLETISWIQRDIVTSERTVWAPKN